MIEISVRFLGGEFVAQTHGLTSEWPPHPARLLYSLIAAWHDGGNQPAEGDTLRWLESQEAPSIIAARDAPDETYEAWLPMNSVPNWDKKGGKRPAIPKTRRMRASRYVGDAVVSFVWPVDAPAQHESALRELCRRCTRLGSAESLVALRVGRREELHGPAWRPSASGTMLRIPMPGIVRAIAGSDTLIPGRVLPCDWRAYRWGSSRRPGRMITVGLARGNWPVEHAPALAAQLRRALIAVAEAEHFPLRPILHGHEEDGSPLRRSHLYLCPLPHIGFRHRGRRRAGRLVHRSTEHRRGRSNLRGTSRCNVVRTRCGIDDDGGPVAVFRAGGLATYTHGRTMVSGREGLADGHPDGIAAPRDETPSVEPGRLASRRRRDSPCVFSRRFAAAD